jgi:hypothetical protein
MDPNAIQCRIRRRMPGIPKDIAALARYAREAGAKADPLTWRVVEIALGPISRSSRRTVSQRPRQHGFSGDER